MPRVVIRTALTRQQWGEGVTGCLGGVGAVVNRSGYSYLTRPALSTSMLEPLLPCTREGLVRVLVMRG